MRRYFALIAICNLLGCTDKYDSLSDLNNAPTLELSTSSMTVNAGDIQGGKLLLVCKDRENNQMNFRVEDSSKGKVTVFFDNKEIFNQAVPIIGDSTIVYVVPMQAGRFELKFVVQDRFGKLDTATLQVISPGNKAPTANFKAKNTGRQFEFDASLSNDEDGMIKFYHFYIDGSEIKSTSPAVKHIFYAPGSYTVKLKVEDYAGALSNEISQTIIVL